VSPPRSRLVAFALLAAFALPSPSAHAEVVVSPAMTLSSEHCGDQDDMCFWLHPTDLSRSTVITSDKEARSLFVYDLQGNMLQALAVPKPGNIDVRYDFPLGGERVDIVALNDRKTDRIRVYKVDRATRLLARVDDDGILTGRNYGFSLYRSPQTGRTYAFTGPDVETVVKQWELVDNGKGRISGLGPIRRIHPGGVVEGMVADDETGMLYLSEESGGVWKFGAEPAGDTVGTRIGTVGEHGLVHDVEGITLYHRAGGAGYLIVSSQGNDSFKVYDRKPPHGFLGTFTVKGTTGTDGCDVINLPLGSAFPGGAFACHNGTSSPCPVELVKWSEIASGLGLVVDTAHWDPRRSGLGDAKRRSAGTTGVELDGGPTHVTR
jgi:3-phytase